MEALRLLPAQRPPLATAEAWGSGANQRLNTQAGRRPLDTEPRRSSRRGCSPSCQERGAGRSIREIRPELPRGRQPAIAQRATGTQTQRRQRRDPCVPGGKFRRVLSRASHRVSLRRNVTRAESTDNTAFRSSCILGSGRRSGTGPDISCQSNDSKEPASKSILPRGVEPLAALSCAAAASSLLLLLPPSASAALLELAPEPSNALSLPTWVIHVASVVEWSVLPLKRPHLSVPRPSCDLYQLFVVIRLPPCLGTLLGEGDPGLCCHGQG